MLSKRVDQYRGSIGRVLTHYKIFLEERAVPEPEETDPDSPMERRVLDWITKTPFYQRNEDRLELFAQFPIGDYLRQLDPTYHHPAYRCDFLLRYRGDEKMVNVILEYDGFKEHFAAHKTIHIGNYDTYYRPEDIERQMVLESYGYKFVRINRFNLGTDPVSTLSERLHALISAATKTQDAAVVDRIRGGANGLRDGSAKHCRKCDQVKPTNAFFDPALRGGQGGVGQICIDCKRTGSTGGPGHRRKRVRRYWKKW